MKLQIFCLLLSCSIHLTFQITQDHGTDLWSMISGNVNNNGVQNSHGLVHQSEISKINGLALLEEDFKQNSNIANFDNGHHKPYIHHNDVGAKEPDVSKEQLYVFLDKGRVRYMPLNEHQKTIVHHSPINVNGRNVHLPAEHVLHNMGLNHHLLNDETHIQTPHCSLCKEKKTPVKSQDVQDHKFKCNNQYHRNHNQYYESHKSNSNAYNPDNAYQRQGHGIRLKSRNPSILQKRGCKTSGGYDSHPKYIKFQCNSNRHKPLRDCTPNDSTLKNKAVLQNTGIRVELQQSNVLLGSTQKQTDENLDQVPTLTQQKTPKSEQSFTTIHKGVIEVSSPNVNIIETTINDSKIESPNGSLTGGTKGVSKFENHDTVVPTAAETEPPILGSALHTDSPIFYVKLKNTKIENETKDQNQPILTQNTENQNFVEKHDKSGNSDSFSTTENIKDLSDENNKVSTFNPLHHMENVLQDIVDTTTPIIETQDVTVMTETLDTNNSVNAAIENENGLEDLAPSEDRLYTYVTKLEKKARQLRKKKKDSKLKKSKSLEPIAYETYLMESNDKPKITKNDHKVHFTPKPKRFIRQPGIHGKRRKPKILKTTTVMVSPMSTSKPALLFQDHESREYSTSNKYLDRTSKTMEKVNDSQLLGSNHLSHDDPYFLDKSDFQISNSPPLNGYDEYSSGLPERQISQYIYSDGDIHGFRSDCSDSTEISFNDDQYFEITNTVTPAYFNSFSDPCY